METFEVKVIRRQGVSPLSIEVIRRKNYKVLKHALRAFQAECRRAANGSRLRVYLDRIVERRRPYLYSSDGIDSYVSPRSIRG